MIWEIERDAKELGEIVNVRKLNDRLEWDFVLGGTSQFCAIFLLDDAADTLKSLKEKKKRPILYQKDLRNYHITKMDGEDILGYRFYPAIVHGGTLYIGNQDKGNTIWINPLKLYAEICYFINNTTGRFFPGKKVQKTIRIELSEEDINKPIFYCRKILGQKVLYSFTYTEERIFIDDMDGGELTFYRDPQCIREIKETIE